MGMNHIRVWSWTAQNSLNLCNLQEAVQACIGITSYTEVTIGLRKKKKNGDTMLACGA